MATRANCEVLDRLHRGATVSACEAKKTRRSRDVSIQEDAALSREVQRHIDALIKHLLIGHDGQPCPAGERPIIQPEVPPTEARNHPAFLHEVLEAGKT